MGFPDEFPVHLHMEYRSAMPRPNWLDIFHSHRKTLELLDPTYGDDYITEHFPDADEEELTVIHRVLGTRLYRPTAQTSEAQRVLRAAMFVLGGSKYSIAKFFLLSNQTISRSIDRYLATQPNWRRESRYITAVHYEMMQDHFYQLFGDDARTALHTPINDVATALYNYATRAIAGEENISPVDQALMAGVREESGVRRTLSNAPEPEEEDLSPADAALLGLSTVPPVEHSTEEN